MNPQPSAYITDILARRRVASRRVEPLDCGCIDPWLCRHPEDDPPPDRMVDAYLCAVAHLDSVGLLAAPRLPEMRMLWRRGRTERRLVGEIASAWELAA